MSVTLVNGVCCVFIQSELEKINGVLSAEYECRRRMLIKRLDVTVQSFSWSDRAKARGKHLIHCFMF